MIRWIQLAVNTHENILPGSGRRDGEPEDGGNKEQSVERTSAAELRAVLCNWSVVV